MPFESKTQHRATVQLNIRLAPPLAKRVRAAAKREHKSLNQFVTEVLTAEIEAVAS